LLPLLKKYNYVLTLELQKKILSVCQKKVTIVTALTSNVLLSNPVKLLEKLYVQKIIIILFTKGKLPSTFLVLNIFDK